MGRGTTKDRSLLDVINRAIFGREFEDSLPRRRESTRTTTTRPPPRERHRHRRPVEYREPEPVSNRNGADQETEEESDDDSAEDDIPVRVKRETSKRVYAVPDAPQRRTADSVDSESDHSHSSVDAPRRTRSQPTISKSDSSRRERANRPGRETREHNTSPRLRRAYTDIKVDPKSPQRDAEISPRRVERPSTQPRPPMVSSR